MNVTHTRLAALGLLVAGSLASSAAHAQPFKPDLVSDGNRWTITAFDDEDSTHTQLATQGICFELIGTFGTHERYRWWSDTFPDWNGIATKEGDQVIMHGDYARDVGHDGMQWEITTSSPRNLGTGHWTEWREDGSFGISIGFGNALFQRVGRCQSSLHEAAFLPLPVDKSGKEMQSPLGVAAQTDQPAR